MNDFLLNVFSKVSGQPINPDWVLKFGLVLRGVGFVIIFWLGFIYFFKKKYWHDTKARKIFYLTLIGLATLVVAKYALFHFYSGYLTDRFPFYALPSPKAKNVLTFLAPLLVASIFWRSRTKIESLSRHKFLLVLAATFTVFSLSVAGIREGVASIIDPFTRTYWEYTGNLPLITTARDFLNQYIRLQPQLAEHTNTHPPGYTLFLFFIKSLLSGNLITLAVALVATVSGIVWPLYYLWRSWWDESTVRKLLMLFIFIPTVVMFTATSMDALFMLLVWLALAGSYLGWRRSYLVSAGAGMLVAVSLFSNFLFLLLAPIFFLLALQLIKNLPRSEQWRVVLRVATTLLAALIFFLLIYLWSGYNLVENFFVARANNGVVVESNFVSLAKFWYYALISLTDFLIYLGLPILMFIWGQRKNLWSQGVYFLKVGLISLLYLTAVGVFQGETARLWLFLVPFIPLALVALTKSENQTYRSAFFACLILHIYTIQTLFYTYW